MDQMNVGTGLDEFLAEDGLLHYKEEITIKRSVVFQISQSMRQQKITKSEMARRMNTSRAAVDWLLDPNNPSVTLITLVQAARVLSSQIKLELYFTKE